MRRPVLPHVLLAVAVRRHVTLRAPDRGSLRAPRVVADPLQLFAETLVVVEVLYGVARAAVDRCPAPRTLRQSGNVEVRGTRPARRVVASSGIPLSGKSGFGKNGVDFLSYIVGIVKSDVKSKCGATWRGLRFSTNSITVQTAIFPYIPLFSL